MNHVLLADKNPALRSALRLLLKTRFGMKWIDEACDMEHVLAQVEVAHPECIILDWELPGDPPHGRVSLLRARIPGLKVIALSLRPESKELALDEGVDAFIYKAESPDQILESIQRLCRLKAKRS